MDQILEQFHKTKDFLICVDSVGCVFDNMAVRHYRCFGPCLVNEWRLDSCRALVLRHWNTVNLSSMTRGVNRFMALGIVLRWVNDNYAPVAGLNDLSAWLSSTDEMSNRSLEKAIAETHSAFLQKALRWSKASSAAIQALPPGAKRPFPSAVAALDQMRSIADLAVVSGANRTAIESEWGLHKLPYDVVLSQGNGFKAHSVASLIEKGYAPSKVLVIGDAPSDMDAAEACGAFFYPILPQHEERSWRDFIATGLPKFLSGDFSDYQEEAVRHFTDILIPLDEDML